MQLRNTTDQDIHLSADQLEQKYSPPAAANTRRSPVKTGATPS